jgi:hypothetical protein
MKFSKLIGLIGKKNTEFCSWLLTATYKMYKQKIVSIPSNPKILFVWNIDQTEVPTELVCSQQQQQRNKDQIEAEILK